MHLEFRGLRERSGLLLGGPAGWGEFSPFPEYPPRMCARWLAAAREAAVAEWPPPLRSRVPVNVTVPAVGPQAAHDIVAASGCSTAKVKVGAGDDVGRVEAVRAALGPHGHLRIDVNAAWDVDRAATEIKRLQRFDLQYAEQPVNSLEEMAALRKRVDVPLAADESVRLAPDPLRITGIGAADVVVLKVQPLGGVRNALRVAEAAGKPAVVSSALETSVGLAAGLALAASLPELPYACGLGTLALLDGDVAAEPLLPVDGFLQVRRVGPDETAMSLFESSPAERAEWLERMHRASAL